MKLRLLLVALLFSACRHDRKVTSSFYYWKTVYKANTTELAYNRQLQAKKLYVRITDVDSEETGVLPMPVFPITFKDKLPDTVDIVPVVYILNTALTNISKPTLDDVAKKILFFVKGKTELAGKADYHELQIDCDWTLSTRDNYFYLLQKLREQTKKQHKILSVTLRLHQLKNQKRNGIPPVDRVMLMCYNMGNLRKYGDQNSILDVDEMKKYANSNVADYNLPVDIALPLFSWAVAFRDKEYIGIPKQVTYGRIKDTSQFSKQSGNMYTAKTNLPQYGLRKNDEIRWENSSVPALQNAAKYLSGLVAADTINVAYFHLDEATIKAFTYEDLDKITRLFN